MNFSAGCYAGVPVKEQYLLGYANQRFTKLQNLFGRPLSHYKIVNSTLYAVPLLSIYAAHPYPYPFSYTFIGISPSPQCHFLFYKSLFLVIANNRKIP